jgi:predicted nuclease of restriction endonuclease-like (RecB) superfamily
MKSRRRFVLCGNNNQLILTKLGISRIRFTTDTNPVDTHAARIPAAKAPRNAAAPDALLDDVRNLIRQARAATAQAVNAALVLLYWEVGHRIRTEVLKFRRAGYGEEICSTLSNELTTEFGPGFSRPNLFRMLRFAEVFPDPSIVSTLSRQLGWSHFVEIIPLKDSLQRDFYAEMCRVERWSVRTLRAKVQSMLFERTALSRKPAELARQELEALREEDKVTPDLVFRDPYLLDFLGLADTYSEKDLETAILRELKQFILELGAGFAFIDQQKHLVIDGKDYYLDLLLYHRRLRRLLALDLKIGAFEAADKGQMELYLRWLERHEMLPGEDTPLGLILCADKGEEQVELLQLDRSGIRVASYLTELPPRPLLQKKLHDAMRLAQARIACEHTDRRARAAGTARQSAHPK